MTIWPGVPLPLPPLLPGKLTYAVEKTGVALIGSGDRTDVGTGSRLGEVYLQLYALDLDDTNAIASFAAEYGTPSGALVHTALARNSLFSALFSPEADRRTREALLDSDSDLQERVTRELTEVTTFESFRFAARFLCDLTDAWRIVNLDGHFDATSHHWRLSYHVDEHTARSRFFALQLLGSGLTPLLARLHPYVVGTAASDEAEPERSGRARRRAGTHVEAARALAFAHLAEFCALELFNHIVGSEVYRHCENETCRRIFVRQYGRAEHGQSRRQAVMYCSRHCAQAQTSRMYRRRRIARERMLE